MDSIRRTFELAVRCHQQSDWRQAEKLCRQILGVEPQHANTLDLLGLICFQSRRNDDAVACFAQALRVQPDFVLAHYHLGTVLRAQGRLAEAQNSLHRAVLLKPDFVHAHADLGNVYVEQNQLEKAVLCYRDALRLNPNFVEAHFFLANASARQGQLDAAVQSYQQALRLKPDYAEARNNLGNALHSLGKSNEAIASYREAVRLRSDYTQAHWNLATTLHQTGNWKDAIDAYRQFLRLRPNSADAHNNLGDALNSGGKPEEAIICYRHARQLRPDFAEAYFNLGRHAFAQGNAKDAVLCYSRGLELKPDDDAARVNLGYALQCQGKFTEAISCYQKALELNADNAEAHLNLGISLPSQLRHDEALLHLRRALSLKPDSALIWNSYLHTLSYCPEITLADLHREHVEFDRLLAAPFRADWRPHTNTREPDRLLRLGFVSPHFDEHPVGSFLIRVLENLDSMQAEVVCYSTSTVKDQMTTRFQAVAHQWCDVADLSDEALADQIRSDRIDILFDLAGHTGSNRLLVFARKPAPIQITWMDYVGTTGLAAMDYILADPHEIPPAAERWYVEKILRMPDDYICYEPPAAVTPIVSTPALTRGAVTFGSFNLLNKLTVPTLAAWSRILHQLPGSNLIIKYRGLEDEGTADRFRKCFTDLGIEASRVHLEGGSPHIEMLSHYQRIDIALDPFPYNGGLTTCEALWMGVPVITCPGETFAGRHALTHLTNIGLTETIARDPEQYVAIAVELGRNLPHLAAIHSRLREQMASSALCDGKRFAENLMTLLRGAWVKWIAS